MYIRSKVVKGATYYQVVEGYRDEAGRVRHRTLTSLGRHPTVADALAATERELRRVRREAERERDLWPASSPRPPRSTAHLATLARRTARLETQRLRLSGLLNGQVVDTTPRGAAPPAVEHGMVSGARVGRDLATLIGMGGGKVDVITTVRGNHKPTWLVAQDRVEATLREHGFPVHAAVWSEPRDLSLKAAHGNRRQLTQRGARAEAGEGGEGGGAPRPRRLES